MKVRAAMAKGREQSRRLWRFLSQDVWDVEISSLSALRAWVVKTVRVVLLVFKGFREDECPLHASALTFSTLMAIVPVLAISLSVARGFGGDEAAKDWMRARVNDWTQTFREAPAAAADVTHAEPPESVPDAAEAELTSSELAGQIQRIVEEGFSRVEAINFTRLGGVGLILLLGMVIQVLSRVESSFNRVWGIPVGRSTWRCFTDYLSVLLILPLLVVAAASLPVLDIATQFLDSTSAGLVRDVARSGFYQDLMVYGLTTLAFTFLLMFMPNTRVQVRAGLAGGAVTALLFLIWLSICAAIQVGVARYGRIYGSFAVVPILLAWVYVSWQVVLLGAEVAFAVQNCTTYRMEQGARNASVEARLELSLTVLGEAARAFLADVPTPPFAPGPFAREHRVSVRFLNDVIEELVRGGYLVRVAGESEAYTLLMAPEKIHIEAIARTLLASGVPASALGLRRRHDEIATAVRQATEGLRESLHGQTVRDLVAVPEGA